MKKSIALVLAALMAALFLASCSQDTDKSNAGSDNSDKSNREMMEVEGGLKVPKIDLGDQKTIKILAPDLPALEADGGTTKLYKELYGGEIVFNSVTMSELYTTVVGEINAGKPSDLVQALGSFPTLALDQTIQPVDGILDMSLDFMKSFEGVYNQFAVGDKHYFLPFVAYAGEKIFYNKKIFEDNEMDTPRELFLKDQWTIDKFIEQVKALTVDKNNDGSCDGDGERWGLASSGYQEAYMLFTTGQHLVNLDQSGAMVPNIDNADLKRVADQLTKLTLTDKVSPKNKEATYNADLFNNNKAAFLIGPSFWSRTDSIGTNIKKAKNFESVPFPRDAKADKHYVNGNAIGFYMVKGSQNKAGAEALIYSYYLNEKLTSVPGTSSHQEAVANWLKVWEQYGYTADDFNADNEYDAQAGEKITLTNDVYSGILHVHDEFYRYLLGFDDTAPATYEQVVNQQKPIMNERIKTINEE